MDSIELINIIKKMLADNLTTSEREQLLDEKPMINFQSQQWKKAPKAHIQDNVVSQNILNKIMVKCRSEKQPILKIENTITSGIPLRPLSLSSLSASG